MPDRHHRSGSAPRAPVLAPLSPSRQHAWLGPTLATAAVLVFFAPVVFASRAFFLKEAQRVIYPTRLVLRERLLRADLPEWLPSLDLGTPFLADSANGVLYPLNALLLLPAPWCVGGFIVAHFLIAALGSWALCRSLGVGRAGAVAGSLGFALGGYLVSLTWSTIHLLSLAWLPVVAWLAWRAFSRRSVAGAALAGVVLGVQALSGEPQGPWMTLWMVLALAVGRPGSSRARLRSLGLFGVMALVGASLAMPQLLPAAELMARDRHAGGLTLDQAQHCSLHPLRLLELLVPWLYGSPLRSGEFLGYFMNDEWSAPHRDPWMVTPSFGGLGLLFAIVGTVRPRLRHRWWTRTLAIATVVALLVALGRHTPVFAAYFSSVPFASMVRHPVHYYALAAATLPWLAAAGIDSFHHREAGGRAFVVAIVAATLLIGGGLASAGPIAEALQALRTEVSVAVARATVLRALTTEIVLLGVLGGALELLRRRRAKWVAVAASGAVAVELFGQLSCAYETAPGSIYSQPPPLARTILERTPPGEIPRTLYALPAIPATDFDELSGPQRAALLAAHLAPDVGIPFGVYYARRYLASEPGPKRNLWQASNQRLLANVFGVRAIIIPGSATPTVDDSLVPLAEVGGTAGTAYWNRRALPYVRAVPHPIFVADREAAIASLTAPEVVQGRSAALELDPGNPEAGSGAEAQCRLLGPPADVLRFRCEVTRAGWVVVNESYHPNFRAKIDGQSAPIVRANGFVMAVWTLEGNHEFTLTYSEPRLVPGLAVSLLGLLLTLGLWRRERARAGDEPVPAHTSPPGPEPSS